MFSSKSGNFATYQTFNLYKKNYLDFNVHLIKILIVLILGSNYAEDDARETESHPAAESGTHRDKAEEEGGTTQSPELTFHSSVPHPEGANRHSCYWCFSFAKVLFILLLACQLFHAPDLEKEVLNSNVRIFEVEILHNPSICNEEGLSLKKKTMN